MFNFFKKKLPDPVSIPETAEEKIKRTTVEGLMAGEKVSHQLLNIAARLFFNVDVPTSHWKLRHSENSPLFFKICGVNPVFSKDQKSVDDIVLKMRDAFLDTSLEISLSVKDLPELMQPLAFKVPKLHSDK